MTKRFITKGRGPGRKVIPLSDVPAIRPVKAAVKDYNDYRISKKYLEDMLSKTGDIEEDNWGISKSGKDLMVRLGNWTTAGWYWSGKVRDMAGFLVRIATSEVQTEFTETMRKNDVDFRKVRGVMLKSIDDGEGFYEISGDNRIWHFSDVPEFDACYELEDTEEMLGIKIDEETKKAIMDKFTIGPDTSIDYDMSRKDYMLSYKKTMRQAVRDSDTFDEFFDEVKDIKAEFTEGTLDDIRLRERATFNKIADEVLKEKGMI